MLGGFLPYVSLFGAFYSLLLQFYVGPKVLYEVSSARAIALLAIILAATFAETFALGTAVPVL
ncbi:TPA: hypothetical protein EYP44_02325 [Candidatus Bathyarchaeota archaeon]|nr:hypothetical protein [Candidatus Bathyarchaeota archaeon]